MNRIALAFRAFFALLFSGELTADVAGELGLAPKPAAKAATKPAPPPPSVSLSDGALQMLGILQRDGRLLDFFLEDIAPYSDEQVGNAARGVHSEVKTTLERYFTFAPVLDAVEGSFVSAEGKDAGAVKFLGNVPAGKPAGGILRHRGWQVTKIVFPAIPAGQNLKLIAPAELEVE